MRVCSVFYRGTYCSALAEPQPALTLEKVPVHSSSLPQGWEKIGAVGRYVDCHSSLALAV